MKWPTQIKPWPASLRPIVLKPTIGLRDHFWKEKDTLVGYNTARWEATSIVSSRSLRGWEMARWMRHICHYGKGLSQDCTCYAMNVYREEYLLPGVQGREGLWTVWLQVRPWGKYKGSLGGKAAQIEERGWTGTQRYKVRGGAGAGPERWFGYHLQCQGYPWRILKQRVTQ